MYCQNCGTVLPDGTPACPACGMKFAAPQQPAYPPQPQPTAYPAQAPYAPPASAPPAPRKKRGGLIVGIVIALVVLLGAGAAFAALALFPAKRTTGGASPAYAPVYPSVAAVATSTLDTSSNTAAEDAVKAFYDAINAGDFAALPSMVTSDTATAVDKGAFARWSTTTVQVVRSVVDNGVAEVFVLESRRAFGSTDRGVEFTLQLSGATWLIQTWTPVDTATLNGATPASGAGSGAATLGDASARDIVSSLLKARQGGDAQTIRLLTTAKFQQDNGSVWLDGVDNSPYFTAFSITSAKAKGAAWIVTVTEQWNSGAETATYTVVSQNGKVLVDSWTSK